MSRLSLRRIVLTLLVAAVLSPYALYELLLNDVATRPITVTIEGEDLSGADAEAIRIERLQLQSDRTQLPKRGTFEWHDPTGLARELTVQAPAGTFRRIERIQVSIGARDFTVVPQEVPITARDDGSSVLVLPDRVKLESLPVPRAGDLINVRFSWIALIIAGLTMVLFAGSIAATTRESGLIYVVTGAFGAAVVASASWLRFPGAIPWLLLVYAAAGWGALLVRRWLDDEAARHTPPDPSKISQHDRAAIVVFLAGVVIVIGLQLWNLGDRTMWTDEFYSFHAARMIQQKGEPVYPTGLHYDRARVYHRLLAATMSVFGNDELGGRLLNLLFNAVTMVTVFAFFGRRNRWPGLIAALAWGLSVTTLDMTRLVRMYAMFTAIFTLSAYALFRAAVKPKDSRLSLRVPLLDLRVDLVWAVVFVGSLLLALDTQRLTVMLLFGLVVYGLWRVVVDRRDALGWLFFLSSVGVLIAGAYIRYETLNAISAYYELSTPFHAKGARFRPWHYTDLFAATVPLFLWVLYVSPVWSAKGKPPLLQYEIALLLGGLLFLIPQDFRTDRFAFALTPFAFIIAGWCIVAFPAKLSRSAPRRLVGIAVALAVLLGVSHLGLFAVEHRSVVSGAERERFDLAFDYLGEIDPNSTTLVADWDAVFTLASRDIYADYILLPESNARVQDGRKADQYLGIPIIVLGGEVYEHLIDSHNTVFVVTRDGTKAELARDAKAIRSSTHPALFRGNGTP